MSTETPKMPAATPTAAPAADANRKRGRVCAAVTRAGTPCHSPVHGDSEFCFFHDKSVPREVRRANSAAGGATHARKPLIRAGDVRLADADECRALIAETVSRLRRNEITTQQANAMCGLLRAGIVAVTATDVQRRLAELENVKKPTK